MNNMILSRVARTVIPLSLILLVAASGQVVLLLSRDLKRAHTESKQDLPAKALEASLNNEIKKPLVVAIIDTGMDVDHPDLQGLLWINPDEGLADDLHGWNFADSSSDISDQHGHGTHIAGIIKQQLRALDPANSRPVQLMILKYYAEGRSGGENLENSNQALAYALDHGAEVINYSGGGREPSLREKALMERARDLGVVIIAAAGNEALNTDRRPFYPASYGLENIISVAGANSAGQISRTSNYGPHSVDITAPGERILSTVPGGREAMMTGTSQATAFVTGAVAAFLASRPVSPLHFMELREQLYGTADLTSDLYGLIRSGGALDLENMLTARSKFTTAFDFMQINRFANDTYQDVVQFDTTGP